jgi:hypothetical protein
MHFSHTSMRAYRIVSAVSLWAALSPTVAEAAENGVSVYPAGVETILPGLMPGAGQSLFLQVNNFYQANGVLDGSGHSVVPGFHLRVAAVAAKFVHNWGVHALGGELVSSVALPVLYEHLDGSFGSFQKTGLGNPDIGVLDVAYERGAWHWWYGVDMFTPGPQYNQNDPLNVGQHNFAAAPVAAFTYLPGHRKNELSSRVQYIVNFTNPADQYRSGGEFVWEYAAMHNIAPKLSVGLNGFYYRQMTNDAQNGIMVGAGNRGRDLAMGPEMRYHMGHVGVILKFQREMLVENRTIGNSFWLQLGMPIGRQE